MTVYMHVVYMYTCSNVQYMHVHVFLPPPANAVILLLVSLLYFYHVMEHKVLRGSLYPVDFLYIIVGLELIFTLPCLVYYIGEPLWHQLCSLFLITQTAHIHV